ncbi:MAG: carbohydrate binding family 9 domain-containing protein [Acidobacteria bacterium]|nr:carbohydrate binding family 9 domain-containing protein [Acidobacteriota bacterium]
MRLHPALMLLALAGAGLFPVCVDAQPSAPTRRSVTAVRLPDDARIVLDGRLDEELWETAVPAGDFVQVDPSNGAPATEPTEVRIVYNRHALYLGVMCFDSEPDKWLGYQRRRDEFLQSDDRFMWTIDTFLDAQSGYFFEMNPSGLMGDSLMGGGIDNRQWDGIWNARVHRGDFGWSIEIEIPFRSLNFDPNSDQWGINFQRTVRRKNEDSIWMGWARNQGLRRMTNAGLLTGIRNVSQGLGLDVKPYALAMGESFPGRGQSSFARNTQAGVDVFYSPTSGLRSVLTVNTDFAQTEVDQRQVNLTRFSLFFPEKRDFFLDGAPYFAFGSPLGGDLIVNPFFSRRIGLTPAGTPQRIDYGGKLTGQLGRQDVGFLHVRTGEDQGIVGEEFTVGRVRRRMLAQSYIGGIYTRRDPHGDDRTTRQTAGLDFRLATSRFRGNQNLEATGYFLHADTPSPQGGSAPTGGGNSFGVTAAMPNDLWNIQMASRQVDAQFDPAIGFVTRRGYRRHQPSVEYGPRPRGSKVVRRYAFSTGLDLQTDLRNDLLYRGIDVKLLDVQFQSQDSFNVTVSNRRERLDAPFTPSRGITLPLGAEYENTVATLRAQTASRRVIALSTTLETGGFYSGDKRSAAISLTLRARPGLIVYASTEVNRVELKEGAFTTRLYRLVGETQFSPWIALVNNFQYDSVSAVLGWQSRFRWILRPGSDVYVVYTHNWLDDPLSRFTTLDRRIASKVLYTHRF